MLTRRRLLVIAAAGAMLPVPCRAAPVHVARGTAMGTRVTLHIAHPEGAGLADRAMAEIARLEAIFSLYREDSALVRLNAAGALDAPPLELLDCLSLADAVHRASEGRFDPSVQPLWRAHAEAVERGRPLGEAERAEARARSGWQGLRLDAGRIALRPGMALTLNGIAQGYVADRVAALLRAEGLTETLIDTGEFVALGGRPGGGDWPVTLGQGGEVGLRGRALATSAPLGMTFGGDGASSHILDPQTGRPVPARWRGITIAAPSAALADALSTAACLMKVKAGIEGLCQHFPGAELLSAVPH